MKSLDNSIPTSALVDMETLVIPDNSTSPWLGGVRLDTFGGSSFDQQVAQAAHSIGVDILSPADTATWEFDDPAQPGYVPLTTRIMVDKAHELGMLVKPWTVCAFPIHISSYLVDAVLQVNRLNTAELLLEMGVDGLITDYPNMMRRLAQQKGYHVAPKYPKKRVLGCLEHHLQLQK
ncbi:hypothetical protein V5O48_005404 [Marasmius crinis-equi]|uniref:GP-PDE domain-containing protein n=1 Tax=Marasmius crinis-equi TaxID=585013 RepID=A0ABR3FME5_9AGAR